MLETTKGGLPITPKRGEITRLLEERGLVIIEAETGAGKSTQVPQWLLQMGLRILHTQPRIVAAREVAERVAYEVGCEFGSLVGYRTAKESCDSSETRCLFVTDGLALVRELMGQNQYDCIILDEVHEWNENMEVLVAWVKKIRAEGSPIKVVVMSATMDSQKLSEYFDGAPRVKVEGRLFPVKERNSQYPVAWGDNWGCWPSVAPEMKQEIELKALEGKNVLAFYPGKGEISEAHDVLSKTLAGKAEVIPLHSEVGSRERKKAFLPPPDGLVKVVLATNIAQTSVTIPDIHAVVDSGLEKRVEVDRGVEALRLRLISKADCTQRKGRAGRVQAGEYVLVTVSQERLDHPVAEIQRRLLDQSYLRLAMAGLKMEEMDFFHQPPRAEVEQAKETLRSLGCIDSQGEITTLGRRVGKLPCSVPSAWMVVKARKAGPAVLDAVATIAACLEDRHDPRVGSAWAGLTSERKSTFLAMLDVFNAAERMPKSHFEEKGIHKKAYFAAKERKKMLLQRVGQSSTREKHISPEDVRRQANDICCRARMDKVFAYSGSDRWGEPMFVQLGSSDYFSRKLDNKSKIQHSGESMLLGVPRNFPTKKGGIVRVVTQPTLITSEWLEKFAPEVTREVINAHYDSDADQVLGTVKVTFRGHEIGKEPMTEVPQEVAEEKLLSWLVVNTRPMGNPVLRHNWDIHRRLMDINKKAGEDLVTVPNLSAIYEEALRGATSLKDVDIETLRLPELGADELKWEQMFPDSIKIAGEELEVEYDQHDRIVSIIADTDFGREWWEKASSYQVPKVHPEDSWVQRVSLRVDYRHVVHGETLAEIWEKAQVEVREERLRNRQDINNHEVIEDFFAAMREKFESRRPEVPVMTISLEDCPLTGRSIEAYATISVKASIWSDDLEEFKALAVKSVDRQVVIEVAEESEAEITRGLELKVKAEERRAKEEVLRSRRPKTEDEVYTMSGELFHALDGLSHLSSAFLQKAKDEMKVARKCHKLSLERLELCKETLISLLEEVEALCVTPPKKAQWKQPKPPKKAKAKVEDSSGFANNPFAAALAGRR